MKYLLLILPIGLILMSTCLPATYLNANGDRVIDPSKLPTEYQEWTYDFGPTRLMRRLYATDNKVTKIESLGYGH